MTKKAILVGLAIILGAASLGICAQVLYNPYGFRPGAEPNGFRGMKWDTNIGIYKDLEPMEISGMAAFYKKKGDPLWVGKAQVESILYGAWNGRFYLVQVKIVGSTNYRNLRDYCLATYGEVERLGTGEQQYYLWNGIITRMILDYNELTKIGEWKFFSKKLQNRRFMEQEE
ncbi:MAG: hypothetical protein AB1491_03360 [Thermodesulfobacteriota bacterium]